jgi:microcystin-dependent protein
LEFSRAKTSPGHTANLKPDNKSMATPFLGEIKIVSFNFPPKGWALCNGQLLPINQNQALFAILGTTYGGNGTTNFALPNFQGCVPMHTGKGFDLGQTGGESTHTLLLDEIPSHTHVPVGGSNSPTVASPADAYWPTTSDGSYSPTSTTTLAPTAIAFAGGNQPHDNMSPYLTLSFCIALQGIFPTRS